MKFFFPLFALLITLAAPAAKAALLIEPLVGFNLGTKLDIEDEDNFSGGGGLGYGGRLGYQQLGFQLGIDYLKSSIDMGSNDIKKNVDVSEWGGFIGFEFPILVRAYVGYIFSGTAETTMKEDNRKFEFSQGSGMKAGVGFTGLPFVVINLEYRKGQFDELKIDGEEDEQTAKYQSLLLSLSLPLTF